MRTSFKVGLALFLTGLTGSAFSQDVTWRAAKPQQDAVPVSLGKPQAIGAAVEPTAPRVVRGQVGDVPPPPPSFPGGGGGPPPVFPFPGTNPGQMYNTGQVNNDADLGGFWSRVGDRMKRSWDEVTGGVTGAFQQGSQRAMFQSDHAFDEFTSPLTNPFFFEDPRALTEVRPIFIWQHMPSSNLVTGGGNDFHYALRGSVAVTEHISLVVSRLGFTTISPTNTGNGIESATGFSELLLGPKITFLRSDTSRTVAAFGLTFDCPVGSNRVLQDTGHLALVPYFSIAQNFGRNQYGSFNFMNTTGYTFRTDNTRTEAIYSSFHLDYEIGKRFYPLIEMNWRHYTRNGGARALNFEGNDLANFGSQQVSGRDELNLALGTRVRFNNYIEWGIAAEFNILRNTEGRHLDAFRLTTDLIFRY